jgi:hypothetical protein
MRGLFIALVLSAVVSLRGARRVRELWGTGVELPEAAPAWETGRLWLLGVGSYKLTRPTVPAADGVGSSAHPLQRGVQNWLVLVGVRLAALPPPGTGLRPEQGEPSAR